MKGYILFRLRRVAVAVALVSAAFLLRLLLDPMLGDRQPYGLFLLAAVVAAWVTDVVEAALVLVLGWLVANWFFETPRHSFAIISIQEWLRSFSYWFIGLAIVLFARSRQAARLRELNASVELRRQEASVASYRGVFDLAPVGLAAVDAASGLFLQVNPRVGQLTGYTEVELLQKRLWEIASPVQGASDWTSLRERLASAPAGQSTEMNGLSKDGSRIRLSLRATLGPAGDKRGARLFCVLEPIVPQPERQLAAAQ